MEKDSKFDGAIDSIWWPGHAARPHESKYVSIFKNFDCEKLHEEEVSREFIESFGKEIYVVINEALRYCSRWQESPSGGGNMRLVPIDNLSLIRLANSLHNFYQDGSNYEGWWFDRFSEIESTDDWRDYISLASEGYDAAEYKSYIPSQLIGICVLFMIDRACNLIRAAGFSKEATDNLLAAHRFIHAAEISDNDFNLEHAAKYASSEAARKKARERHSRDPKQIEKKFIFECWKEWQKNPEKYNGQAAFARDMLDKCQNLKSQKKIEDWCREWKKQ